MSSILSTENLRVLVHVMGEKLWRSGLEMTRDEYYAWINRIPEIKNKHITFMSKDELIALVRITQKKLKE